MKYTIALLVVLGFVAAICAVLLVNVLRADKMMAKSDDVHVITAAQDIPSMSIVTSDAIEQKEAKEKEIPEGACANAAQVVGKILAVSVVKGQVLTASCFVSEGSGAKLAASLPAGMRAVTVSLSNQSVSGGLLYPGCIVDVLASFKLTGGLHSEESKGEAISTTLLHGVQVLVIQGETVISQSEIDQQKEKVSPKAASANQTLAVTLLVDSKQAEALQLARDNGQISLAMRNPLDTQPVDVDATVLSRGRLSKLGSLLGSTVPKKKAGTGSAEMNDEQDAASQTDPLHAFMSEDDTESANWEVTVIRGNQVKDEELKIAD